MPGVGGREGQFIHSKVVSVYCVVCNAMQIAFRISQSIPLEEAPPFLEMQKNVLLESDKMTKGL